MFVVTSFSEMEEKESKADKSLRSLERSDLKSRIEELKRRIAEVEGEANEVPKVSFSSQPKNSPESEKNQI